MRTQTSSLPNPRRERWQPLRSGIVNLYRYDSEEFHYENGRLLLRGNNGTGKSRVLALQLPFLLDGETNPERLEPDADPSKKIEWNLLMGRYPDRTGYTWIEFGRCDDAGNEHYLTVGCGLSAVEGKTGVRQWFFITTQRIGQDLDLVSKAKQVLGKDRLRSAIGSAGQVIENAGAYRRAVNEALFQLDEYRYASLMNLLIQLRRPQLTRRLEEVELSRALSEALPPVSPALISEIAEAFRHLQSDRSDLDSSRVALSAVEQFLNVYRGYAEIAAKRSASRVLAAHEEYEAAMKELLTAEAECDRSLAELARLKAEMQRISLEEHALQAEIAAFQQSPHLKDAQALEYVQREAAEKRRDVEIAAAELADASQFRKSCSEEHLRLSAILEQRQLRLASATKAAANAATAAGLADEHRKCLSVFNAETPDEAALKEAQAMIASAIQQQMEKCRHLAGLNERIASARSDVQRAGAAKDQLCGLLDDARERLNAAREDHQSTITSFLDAASNWTANLTELPLPFDEEFLRSVTAWCDKPHGPNPFAAAGRKAVEDLSANFSDTRAYLKHREQELTSELNQLEAEAETLEVQGQLDSLSDSLDDLNRREAILRSEAHGAPADESVCAAYDFAVAVLRHLDGLRNRVGEAEKYAASKQSQLDQAIDNRDRAATDLRITEWADCPTTLESGIAEFQLALSSFWSALQSFQEARSACDWVWTYLEQATAREARQKETVREVERRSVAADRAREAAAQTVDTSYGEILERISRSRERLEALRIEEKETRLRFHDTEVAVTRVDERLRSRTAVLNGDTDRRETAAVSLRTFASTGLVYLAAPEFETGDPRTWSTTQTVEAALELTSRLVSIDAGDEAWQRHQKSVASEFTVLMQVLSTQGCRSSAAFRDDIFVASAVFAGREYAMSELRETLLDNVTTRQILLQASAKEILENQLVGKVSRHLRELLLAAEEQVRDMNVELASRPMSTGMKLRFVWRSSETAPTGLTGVRPLLMQSKGAWSQTERQTLGAFLQQQIEAVFADAESLHWQESLAEALDYRKWHWFGVERYQDGAWKRLTRRTHGTGSGGEKAVALTLPHFAAAAAFYRSAGPQAPRLILLDEAFVGIDADMRAKCMGLIDIFDLDFMMTSEREWGCYQTLPGIAIYHLSTRPDIDAIGLTRWVWNGHQRSLLHNTKDTNDVGTHLALTRS
jgi:hypothetical protein